MTPVRISYLNEDTNYLWIVEYPNRETERPSGMTDAIPFDDRDLSKLTDTWAWQQPTRPALPEAVAYVFDASTAEIWHGEQPA